jgi:hypothetical protein
MQPVRGPADPFVSLLATGRVSPNRAEGMRYGLLWSTRGGLYLRHGFVRIPYARVSVAPAACTGAVRPFAPADAPEVMRLQRAVGPVQRSAADWDFELRRLRRRGVHGRSPSSRDLAGYVRARRCRGVVELRDLAVADRRVEVARALLAAVADDASPVVGPLPRWLSTALGATQLPPGEDLMGAERSTATRSPARSAQRRASSMSRPWGTGSGAGSRRGLRTCSEPRGTSRAAPLGFDPPASRPT